MTPSFGVLEIPPGCAANTDEWVLPASFQRTSTVQSGNPLLVNFTIPTFPRELSVHVVRPEIDNKPRALDELNSISDMISSVLGRNENARDLAGTSVKTLRYLASEADQLEIHSDTMSILGNVMGTMAMMTAIGIGIIGWLEWKKLTTNLKFLSTRLTAHELLAGANEPEYIEITEPPAERAI